MKKKVEIIKSPKSYIIYTQNKKYVCKLIIIFYPLIIINKFKGKE